MAKKTAMQELIDYLELCYGSIDSNIKEEFVSKEKEQIIRAFDDGEKNDFYSHTTVWTINGKQYYKKRFNNE